MTIHFAAARTSKTSPLARTLIVQRPNRPANDNSDQAEGSEVLEAALRHFGEHGLGAALSARQKAETAFFSGDRAAYNWWLEVCRVLDRRMANNLKRKAEHS